MTKLISVLSFFVLFVIVTVKIVYVSLKFEFLCYSFILISFFYTFVLRLFKQIPIRLYSMSRFSKEK